MDSRLNIPAPSCSVEPPRDTWNEATSGFVDDRLSRVGASREVMREAEATPNPSRVESTGKKSWLGSCKTSVP